jgi:hypothetical protein
MPVLTRSRPARALFALALAVLAALALGACGGSSKGSSASASASKSPATMTTTTTGSGSGYKSPGTTATTPGSGKGAPGNGTGSGGSAKAGTGKSRGGIAASPRAKALRACLVKAGVLTSQATPGSSHLRKGITPTQLRTAIAKCGGLGSLIHPPKIPLGSGRGSSRSRGLFTQALVNYVHCMQKQGIKLPAPNTSGKGPIFSNKSLETKTPAFRAAAAKCRKLLPGIPGLGVGGTGA